MTLSPPLSTPSVRRAMQDSNTVLLTSGVTALDPFSEHAKTAALYERVLPGADSGLVFDFWAPIISLIDSMD
jgi:precorrin-6x reductase